MHQSTDAGRLMKSETSLPLWIKWILGPRSAGAVFFFHALRIPAISHAILKDGW